jgi:serine/threonine protein kinase
MFSQGCRRDLISTSFPYQVLEYMGGGDLLNLLIERDVFEEDFTRFYIAEVVTSSRIHCKISD